MVTADEILTLNPCWEASRIREAVGAGITYRQVAEADVPVADRRWLLTRLAARTDAGRRVLVRWAAECARAVQPAGADPRSLAAIALAVEWAEGGAVMADQLRNAAIDAPCAADPAAYAADPAAYAAAYVIDAADAAIYATSSTHSTYAAESVAAYVTYAAHATDAAAAAYIADADAAADAQLIALAVALGAAGVAAVGRTSTPKR